MSVKNFWPLMMYEVTMSVVVGFDVTERPQKEK